MSIRKPDREVETQRRSFLKGAAKGAAAAGATLVVGQAVAAVSDEAPQTMATGKRGYQETDHVKAYYRLARF
ncbi:MAG: twin-arginine translocation signal domain-containing protein [Arenicellales bacterium WSBS_2016_MAG_OTU3]